MLTTSSLTTGMRVDTADEDHVVEVALLDAGVLQRLLERHPAALDEVGRQLLELATG